MWLTEVAIRRPVFILMVVAALIVLGFVGMSRMPAELVPKIDFPVMTVVTFYPGAGPEEVEELVTKPIEDAVAIVNNVDTVTSTSQENVSTVVIQLFYGTDLDVASSDVRDAIDRAKAELPDDAEDPILVKADVAAIPVIVLGVIGDRPPAELRRIADDIIKDRFSKIPGVASASVTGGQEREVLVSVDKGRLDAIRLPIMGLVRLLASQNMNVPSGSVKQGRKDYTVRLLGRFTSVEEIENVRLSTPLGVFRLGDIAEVVDTEKAGALYYGRWQRLTKEAERLGRKGDVAAAREKSREADEAYARYVDLANIEDITRTNLRDSVAVTIQKQSDANTVQVADATYEAIEELKRILPKDIEMVIALDTSEMVRESLRDVREALILGAILAAVVVYLFLHEIRGTFIVVLAIPTSIMATFLPISLFGFTINMMVLLGLSLSVGILVDDSIVVIENIHRHLQRGEQPAAAALNGRSEIGFAAITITLVDVVVFIPVAFMGGVVGQFFFSFGITVTVVTLFSLFVSFTLTPMLASRWFERVDVAARERIPTTSWQRVAATLGAGPRKVSAVFDRFYDGLAQRYQRMLQRPVRSRFIVRVLLIVLGIVALLVVVGATMRLKLVGSEFMPRTDEGQISIKIECPAGTRLEATNAIVREVEALLADRQRFPEVEEIQTTVGSYLAAFVGGASNKGPQYAEINVGLVKKRERNRSDVEIADLLSEELNRYKNANITVQAYSSGFGGTEAPLQIQVMGNDQEELREVAGMIADAARSVRGVVDVDVSYKPGKPEVQVRVDRLKAADLGISVAEVAAALRASLAGDTSTKYRERGEEYDIRVRLRGLDRANTSDVASILVGVSDMGLPLRVADVATVGLASGPTKVERRDRQRMIVVSANMTRETVLRTAQQEIQAKINEIAAMYASGRTASNPAAETGEAAGAGLEIADTPIGTTYVHWGGEAERYAREMGYLFQALALSIALVYMLMAALFNSLRDPFVILTQLPLSLVGAFLALALTHNNLSIVSMIGVIMLMGIVGKNAILMVDYTNTLRARGYDREQAVLEAGPTRMRPILMTTAATIFAMLPTAVQLTQGAEWRSPMAIVVIGGLALSTVVTLVMIPLMYTVAEDFTDFFRRLYHHLFRHVPWEETLQYTERLRYRGAE